MLIPYLRTCYSTSLFLRMLSLSIYHLLIIAVSLSAYSHRQCRIFEVWPSFSHIGFVLGDSNQSAISHSIYQ